MSSRLIHEPPGKERRPGQRKRIASPCVIDLGPMKGKADGILRELDEDGARIKLSARNLTLSGRVSISTNMADAGIFIVVWQTGQLVGLKSVKARTF